MTRKPIQILPGTDPGSLFALCQDGSIWLIQRPALSSSQSDWIKLPDIPAEERPHIANVVVSAVLAHPHGARADDVHRWINDNYPQRIFLLNHIVNELRRQNRHGAISKGPKEEEEEGLGPTYYPPRTSGRAPTSKPTVEP